MEIQVYGAGEKIGNVSTGSLPVLRTFVSSRLSSLVHRADLSGKREPPVQNWQRLVIDIPNDKLFLSVKEARPSYMPTRIQALVVVRQRVNGFDLFSSPFAFRSTKRLDDF